MSVWLVVPAPGERTAELRACLTSLGHPPGRTVVVTSRVTEPVAPAAIADLARNWIIDGPDGVNIGRWWNAGLDLAYEKGATEVAVFSSDVTGVAPCDGIPGSVDRLAASMRSHGCVMGGPNFVTGGNIVMVGMDRTVHKRVPGGCFMLAAEHRLRCDESYRWWYTDDDVEAQARQLGPVGIFAGTGLVAGADSELDDDRERWAVEDRARYVAEWGVKPW